MDGILPPAVEWCRTVIPALPPPHMVSASVEDGVFPTALFPLLKSGPETNLLLGKKTFVSRNTCVHGMH